MQIRKMVGFTHRWLGLLSGLVVLFLGITGCILAFQQEIESITQPFRYVKEEKAFMLPPSVMKPIAENELPGKHPHSVSYEKGKASQVVFYGKGFYDIVYLNPYTGAVLKTVNMNHDFFRTIVAGHYNLWLPVEIGQPIVASATLIFLVLLITGIILWWPRNKAARKQRFRIKWNLKWKRKNYDLHNVLGFYMSWIAVFIAVTGLVMGFQWFAGSIYYATSGGVKMKPFYEAASDKAGQKDHSVPAVDAIYDKAKAMYPSTKKIEIHYPATDSSAIEIAANPDPGTYWKTDYRFFDQYTLKEIEVNHMYGQLRKASVADKIARMNYDVHVGAIGGWPTKLLAFFASLIAASLPVTGFMIWRGRRRKENPLVQRNSGISNTTI